MRETVRDPRRWLIVEEPSVVADPHSSKPRLREVVAPHFGGDRKQRRAAGPWKKATFTWRPKGPF